MALVLVVDDEPAVRRSVRSVLERMNHEVHQAEDGVEAQARLKERPFDLVVTDINMPRADGFAVIAAVRKGRHKMPIVVLTGQSLISDCVAVMRAGATNFLTKPFHIDELEKVVRDALSGGREAEEHTPKTEAAPRPQVALLGESEQLKTVLELVERVAPTDATVLLTGESGTGKEVIARLIHGFSCRVGAPFIAINCGAIPEGLLESELFGHARGAFTGATDKRVGQFAQADGGTIFLDEIGELPLLLQVKLLRVIQEREITPVGEARPIKVNVRVIAATHRNLETMVTEGKFRDDLYYRLNVVPIEMPPLRERANDVLLLAHHFLEAANGRYARSCKLSEGARAALQAWSWLGNVRELENLIERLVIVTRGEEISLEALLEKMQGGSRSMTPPPPQPIPASGMSLPDALDAYESELIKQALEKTGGNKQKAADLLGLNRTTLVEKLKRKQ